MFTCNRETSHEPPRHHAPRRKLVEVISSRREPSFCGNSHFNVSAVRPWSTRIVNILTLKHFHGNSPRDWIVITNKNEWARDKCIRNETRRLTRVRRNRRTDLQRPLAFPDKVNSKSVHLSLKTASIYISFVRSDMYPISLSNYATNSAFKFHIARERKKKKIWGK